MDNNQCHICSKSFATKSNKTKHVKSFHPMELIISSQSMDLKKGNILCPLCHDPKEAMPTYKILTNHLQVTHDVIVEEENLLFSTSEEFESWIKLNEKDVNYVVKRTRSLKYKTIRNYECNQSNTTGFKSNCTQRTMKKGGSIKINGVCPSRILVNIYKSGEIKVCYVKTHVGHSMDHKRHQKLTQEQQDEIIKKLQAGVSDYRIIKDARNQITPEGKYKRANLLKIKDLQYLRRKCGIIKKRDSEDMVAVALKVKEWNADGKNSAFLFKNTELIKGFSLNFLEVYEYWNFYVNQRLVAHVFVGESHQKLTDADFALGFMNSTMENKLKQFKRIICMDGTHGTNSKKYELTVMMVIDNENRGFPVAFFLSNRQDQLIQEIFLEALKNRLGEIIVPEFFMSDGDKKYHEAWTKIMDNKPRRLLCTWHVIRCWDIRGRKKIQSSEIKNDMKKKLKEIMMATKEEDFTKLKSDYLKKLADDNEILFLEYLEKYYFKDEDQMKMWAYCHRVHAGINTNMALERFNGALKGLLGRNARSTLEKLLDTLDEAVDNKMWNNIISMERLDSNSYQDRKTTKAHKRAAQRQFEGLEIVGLGVYQIQSRSGTASYAVYSNQECIDKCSYEGVTCRECGVCRHKYVCECVEYAVKSNVCVHVHMVHMYESRRVLAESVLGNQEDLIIEEPSEVNIKLNEAVEEFVLEKYQQSHGSEPAVMDETEKRKIEKEYLNSVFDKLPYNKFQQAFKENVAKWDGSNIKGTRKRKMDKQTYFPQQNSKKK